MCDYLIIKSKIRPYLKYYLLTHKEIPKHIVNIINQTPPITLENSLALPLENFKIHGRTTQNQLSGKNLFDINAEIEKKVGGIQYSISGNVLDLESYSTGGAQYVVYAISGLDPTKNYKISCKGKKLVAGVDGKPWIKIAIRGSNNDGATYTGEIASKTIQELVVGQQYDLFPSQIITGYSFYGIYIYNNAGIPVTIGEKTQYYDIQFEEGSTATSYEPYCGGVPSPNPEFPQPIQNVSGDITISVSDENNTNSQEVEFPLAEGQKLMEGDYIDKDGIHHVRDKIVFDGSEDESWGRSGSLAVFYNDDIANIAKVNGDYLCDHFIKIPNNSPTANMTSGETKFNTTSSTRLFFKYTDIETVTAFKEWLSNNNMTLEYELEEETIETFTEAQATKFEEIKALTGYNNITIVNATSNDLAPNLSFDYYAKGR